MTDLTIEIQKLRIENENLKKQLEETKEHLKKYTSPSRYKKYYQEHKEELLAKMKSYVNPDKKKEYNKNYYLRKKEEKQKKENI